MDEKQKIRRIATDAGIDPEPFLALHDSASVAAEQMLATVESIIDALQRVERTAVAESDDARGKGWWIPDDVFQQVCLGLRSIGR